MVSEDRLPSIGRLTNELRDRQAHLLGVNRKLPLHGRNLLWAGHHGHLAALGPALGTALGRRSLHGSEVCGLLRLPSSMCE